MVLHGGLCGRVERCQVIWGYSSVGRALDAAMIQVAKNSPVIVSNVSAQEISRTQDTNAGEVIRRVPVAWVMADLFLIPAFLWLYKHLKKEVL